MAKRKKKRGVPLDFTRKEFKPYAILIGQCALAWNELHERLNWLFSDIVGTRSAFLIWNSSYQDRAKREMIGALLNLDEDYSAKISRRLADEIKWILSEVQKIEDTRNTVIHAPLYYIDKDLADLLDMEPRVEPYSPYGNRRAAKLKQKDILIEYQWCRDSCSVLAEYSVALHDKIIEAEDDFPTRPKLPSRGQRSASSSPTAK